MTENDIIFYTEDGKFRAPLFAGDLVYEMFDHELQDGINRGFLTISDTKEIMKFNEIYYETGEDYIRDQTQKTLGKQCTTYHKNEVVGWIKDRQDLRINRDLFDSEIHLINLENCIYNIRTKKIIDHNPQYLFTYSLPIKYDPDATINNLEQFFKDVLYKDDIPTIQELFGYCLYREYPYQKAFMFDGDGSNGKSTLINVLSTFLGKNNVSNVSLQDLMYRRFSRAMLYRKMANLYSDLSDQAVKQTGLFKMLTGSDLIFADQKFKEPFYFKNYSKLIFSTNKIPVSDDDTDAYFRRWILISFPNKFEGSDCKPNIIKQLTTQPELSGLFNWSIEGLLRLLENNSFSNSKSTEKIRDEYQRKMSPISAFVKDCIEEDMQSEELKEDVYNEYKKYCIEEKLPIKASNVFSRDFKMYVKNISEGQKRIGNGSKRTWQGVRLNV